MKRREIRKLDSALSKVRPQVPHDFQRKPRSVAELDRWKATEFRMFLIYTGPIVLKDVLRRELYDHFLLLSVGIQILLSNNEENFYHSEYLLFEFVKQLPILYDKSFAADNVHCLTH